MDPPFLFFRDDVNGNDLTPAQLLYMAFFLFTYQIHTTQTV